MPRPGDEPVTLQVVHVDLYFFYGVDIVLLNVEVAADDLPLALAQELMYRFGRAYPAGWDAEGQAVHCLAGRRVARRERRRPGAQRRAAARGLPGAPRRAPRAAHLGSTGNTCSRRWSITIPARQGPLRFRQIEYYRMPMMAYLAVDDPRLLTRSDFIRLGLVTGGGESVPGSEVPLPYAETHVADFEQQFCYDRFWAESGAAPNTRYLCSGLALIAVGDAQKRVLPLRRPRRARPVPPPALPALPDRALPEGRRC